MIYLGLDVVFMAVFGIVATFVSVAFSTAMPSWTHHEQDLVMQATAWTALFMVLMYVVMVAVAPC